MYTLAEQHAHGVLHMCRLLRLVAALALGNAYVMSLVVVGAVGLTHGTSWQHLGLAAGVALGAVPLVAGGAPHDPGDQIEPKDMYFPPPHGVMQPTTFYLRTGT